MVVAPEWAPDLPSALAGIDGAHSLVRPESDPTGSQSQGGARAEWAGVAATQDATNG